MAKTYMQKVSAYKATCRNMAGLEVLNVKYKINCEDADAAAHFARRAAHWIFSAYPELREPITGGACSVLGYDGEIQ